MVDRATLSRRLDALAAYLKKLRAFQAVPEAEFVAQPELHDLAERYLHLAVEAVLDIAHHLIADLGLETPDLLGLQFAEPRNDYSGEEGRIGEKERIGEF